MRVRLRSAFRGLRLRRHRVDHVHHGSVVRDCVLGAPASAHASSDATSSGLAASGVDASTEVEASSHASGAGVVVAARCCRNLPGGEKSSGALMVVEDLAREIVHQGTYRPGLRSGRAA